MPVASEIIESGYMSPEDLLIGSLEAGSNADCHDWRPYLPAEHRGYEGKPYPNPVAQLLFTLAGIERWYYDDYAVDRFDLRQWQHEFAQEFSHSIRRWRITEPNCGDQQFLLFHDGRQYRVRPFGVWGVQRLSDLPSPVDGIWISRGNVLQPVSRFQESSMEEIEYLINTGSPEKEFQHFFERNPEFLLVLGNYQGLHPQLILHEDSGERLIPDFFLERIDSDMCDICDLKRPTAALVRRQERRERFGDVVMEGVAQLERYRNWFEDSQHRSVFRRKYGLTAYRPRVVLIIGRRADFFSEVERLRLAGLLSSHVDVRTYDDVLTVVRAWRRFLEGRS